MTTAEIVMARALALARARADETTAVSELLACCGENRVSVVMARRRILDLTQQEEEITVRAAGLLDELLVQLSEV